VARKKSFVGAWKEYWRLWWREGLKNDDPVFELLPERITEYLVIAGLAIGVSFVIGSATARTQNEYSLVASQGETRTLIVSKNDSELITKDYNVSSKSFEDGYSVENISEKLKITTFNLREQNYSIFDRLQ
jgi:hypothetical protein